jgi:apolipoprotein N-acyltransferase
MAVFVLAVPVLWTLAESRYSAFAVILAYKLAASRGLISGAAVFLAEDHTPLRAAALYLLMSLGVSLPFLVFWSEKRLKPVCLILAFATAYVLPPISLIGIINPLLAAGTVFRGWGLAGMTAALGIYALCAVSRRTAYAALCVIAIFAALPSDNWYSPPSAEGIMAVDTSFGRLGSGSYDFERDYERAGMVFGNLRRRYIGGSDAQIVVLPETIAGRLNNAGLNLWQGGLRRSLPDKTLIFGAKLPTGEGRKYDNAMVMLHEDRITVSRQRIPVPYSMYVGPLAAAGANLHLGESGILPLPDGRKAAAIICYEAFLTWPYLASMIRKPDVIICIANLWWCRESSIPDAQRRIVSLWSLTFGTPAVFARNI